MNNEFKDLEIEATSCEGDDVRIQYSWDDDEGAVFMTINSINPERDWVSTLTEVVMTQAEMARLALILNHRVGANKR